MGLSAAAVSISPGNIDYFAANTPPAGWIKANGAAVSRATYAALFTVIGTTYGVGDGSTTFNVPDLRGEFPRGWDDARGVDSGRVIASAQAANIAAHGHTFTVYSLTDGTGITRGSAGGGSTGVMTSDNFGTGTDTRPRNVALLACIKY